MQQTRMKQHQNEFDTNFRYAIVAGWLIIPAIGIIFNLLAQIFYLVLDFWGNTSGIPWGNIVIDLALALLFIAIIYLWVKRKRILPVLMIIYLSINLVQRFILMFLAGSTSQLFYAVFTVIWIVYFIRSRRVKATFVN